ncbi:hypothetical protein PHLGIDRAFT_122614 [Phlebiopsis gigantea 11061_1 CR5-6]|uniref:NAD(P)-binding domain-containing protein n=1 Tax=Phlebiopsis gigantea (strain 11061_1 CR5-6) TaxID=745531 RepID=A0A0C3RQU3_PHLG1|nr:hypothetical protein PHLGIDRAFT_122614 [Phlebiopsis gigantea 11061_1 CR5-6]
MHVELTALVLGATGATGRHILNEVLLSERFTRVGEYGRSLTPETKLPQTKGKLEQKKIDFENLDQAAWKQGNWDVVFIALGTTRAAAGSAEAFERIDREYVLNAARAAKSDDPTRKQRLIYVSSSGANAKAHFLYMKSKGLTEQGLVSMGYDDVIIFRPGALLNAERKESRIFEKIAMPLFALATQVTDRIGISVDTVGKSIRIAGELGSQGIPANLKVTETFDSHSYTVIGNAEALKLATL